MTSTGEAALADRLRNIEVEVAKLGVTIENLVATLKAERRDAAKRESDFETRLRAVEARVQRAAGMALIGGGLLGSIGGSLLDWVTRR